MYFFNLCCKCFFVNVLRRVLVFSTTFSAKASVNGLGIVCWFYWLKLFKFLRKVLVYCLCFFFLSLCVLVCLCKNEFIFLIFDADGEFMARGFRAMDSG